MKHNSAIGTASGHRASADPRRAQRLSSQMQGQQAMTTEYKGLCNPKEVTMLALAEGRTAYLVVVCLQRMKRHGRAHIPHFRLAVQRARKQMERRLWRPGNAGNPPSVHTRRAAQCSPLHCRLRRTRIPQPNSTILVSGCCVYVAPRHSMQTATSSGSQKSAAGATTQRAVPANFRSHKYLVEHPRPQGRSMLVATRPLGGRSIPMCRVLALTETRVSLYFNICSRFNHRKDARSRAPTNAVAGVAAVGICSPISCATLE